MIQGRWDHSLRSGCWRSEVLVGSEQFVSEEYVLVTCSSEVERAVHSDISEQFVSEMERAGRDLLT